MLKSKLLIGAGAVIIAAGGAGTVLHLQKNAPHTPIETTSSSEAFTPAEEIPASAPTEEILTLDSEALPVETVPEAPVSVTGTDNASLYDKGLEVISLMQEECRSESWLSLYASGSLLDSEAFAKVQNGDYSAPKKVYKATLPEENIDLLLSIMGGSTDLSALSEPLDDFLRSRLLRSWINMLNARMGADYVAAGSIITAEKTFVSTQAEENCIYIYTYENACPVAVIYTVGDGGAVLASGQVILTEPFETGSAVAVAQSLLGTELTGYDLSLFEVEEIN